MGLAGGWIVGRPGRSRVGPSPMVLVGVSATTVYGLAAATRQREPRAPVFQLPRDGLFVKVHQRMNVRVLELVEDSSRSRIELEGNRLPLTDSEDVIDVLTES